MTLAEIKTFRWVCDNCQCEVVMLGEHPRTPIGWQRRIRPESDVVEDLCDRCSKP